jgi:hypothetical protein
MIEIGNGLFYTVEHYRLPNFSYVFKKKGKPNEDDLVRFMHEAKIWLLEDNVTHSTDVVKPHTTGGKTIVYIRNAAKEVLATGVMLCSMSETYSYKYGREEGLKRALDNYNATPR